MEQTKISYAVYVIGWNVIYANSVNFFTRIFEVFVQLQYVVYFTHHVHNQQYQDL